MTTCVVYKSPLPKRPIPEGVVPCPRKGPTHDFIAFEKCEDTHSRSPDGCGACKQHLTSRAASELTRIETGRKRWRD